MLDVVAGAEQAKETLAWTLRPDSGSAGTCRNIMHSGGKKDRRGGGHGASGNPRSDSADSHGDNRTTGKDNGGSGNSETDTLVLLVENRHEGAVGATRTATGGQ